MDSFKEEDDYKPFFGERLFYAANGDSTVCLLKHKSLIYALRSEHYLTVGNRTIGLFNEKTGVSIMMTFDEFKKLVDLNAEIERRIANIDDDRLPAYRELNISSRTNVHLVHNPDYLIIAQGCRCEDYVSQPGVKVIKLDMKEWLYLLEAALDIMRKRDLNMGGSLNLLSTLSL